MCTVGPHGTIVRASTLCVRTHGDVLRDYIVYCDLRVPRASIMTSLGLRFSELGKELKSCAVESSGDSYLSELTERT